MHIDLSGKIALVNAGSQGIGKAVALGLSKAGAEVCITARNSDSLQEGTTWFVTTTSLSLHHWSTAR